MNYKILAFLSCHPFLRRDFFALFTATFRRHRVANHDQITNDHQSTVSQLALRDIITGRTLISGVANGTDQFIEANEHFAMLKEMWEKR